MRHRTLPFAVAVSLCSCGSPAPDPTASASQKRLVETVTIARLRRFEASVNESTPNDTALEQYNQLNQDIADDQLVTVEKFASTRPPPAGVWVYARLLMDRNRPDAAAGIMVTQLLDVDGPAARMDRMWRWWEANFNGRPETARLNQELFDAMMTQFDRGPHDRKLVVAELFGKGEPETALPTAQFRALLEPTTKP